MTDLMVGCHTVTWGRENFVQALADISDLGLQGVEAFSSLVEEYEDRLEIFKEILVDRGVQMVALDATANFQDPALLEEEVERIVNIARFLKANDARQLVLDPGSPPAEGSAAENWKRFCGIVGEIGKRTLEMGVKTCVHLRPGSLIPDTKAMDSFLDDTPRDAIFACVDTGVLERLDARSDRVIGNWDTRIGHVQFKDVPNPNKRATRKTRIRDKIMGKPLQYCEIGKGIVDFPKIVKALAKAKYSGWIVIELDATYDQPKLCAQTSKEYLESELDFIF